MVKRRVFEEGRLNGDLGKLFNFEYDSSKVRVHLAHVFSVYFLCFVCLFAQCFLSVSVLVHFCVFVVVLVFVLRRTSFVVIDLP
jgi:hypothetical protein